MHLGVFSLEAPGVPILLSVKTLRRLGALIDVARRCIVFQSVDENVAVRLEETSSGHLLIDLTQDWLTEAVTLDFSSVPKTQECERKGKYTDCGKPVECECACCESFVPDAPCSQFVPTDPEFPESASCFRTEGTASSTPLP